MPSARLIIDQLRAGGITHVVALPDNTSKALLEGLAAQPEIHIVSITREGEAWAVAAGIWIGGGSPAVLMQNTGFLESGDALRGTAMRMRIPLLCLLTYRGYATLTGAQQRGLEFGVPSLGLKSDPSSNVAMVNGQILSQPALDSCAVVFEPTLRAWGMPYDFLHDDADIAKVRSTLELARQREHPAALLITRDTA